MWFERAITKLHHSLNWDVDNITVAKGGVGVKLAHLTNINQSGVNSKFWPEPFCCLNGQDTLISQYSLLKSIMVIGKLSVKAMRQNAEE